MMIGVVGQGGRRAVITAIGSGFNYPSISSPQGMAGLTATSFAYSDPSLDTLRRYTVDTGTGAITYSANATLGSVAIAMTQTGENQIGNWRYTGVANSPTGRATWNGSSFTLSGNPPASGIISNATSGRTCKVATDVMVVSTQNGGGTFSWGGSRWEIINGTTPGTDGGPRPMAYRSDNLVAVLSPSGAHYHLRDWTRNGSTWAHSGNQLLVEVSGITQIIPMRSGTRLVAYSPTEHIAVVFDKIGASWVEVGRAAVGSQSATQGTICGLSGTDYFVQVDATDKTFRLYRVD